MRLCERKRFPFKAGPSQTAQNCRRRAPCPDPNASEAARRFPLLKLRPGEWEAPFVAMDAEGKEVESSPPAIEVPGSWRSSQEL